MFSLCLHWFSLVTLASSYSPRTYKLGVKLIGHSELPVGVNVSADDNLSLLAPR